MDESLQKSYSIVLLTNLATSEEMDIVAFY